MAPLSFLAFLALALSVHSRPQSHDDAQRRGEPNALSIRSLPVVDNDVSMGTLPVPRGSKNYFVSSEPSGAAAGSPLGAPSNDDVRRSLPFDEDASGILTLPVIHAKLPELDKRGVEITLENRSDVAYYAELKIGNPPQKVFAQIDTGSFELWVNPDCRGLAAPDQKFCRAIGKYDPTRSSTSVISEQGTSLKYGIGAANITYVADDIALSDSASMKKVQFGVATSSQDQFSGILGIGYGNGFTIRYNNFIDELALQNVTRTKAFSVALGSKDEGKGVVVFGGVDTSKFGGDLAPLPIIPASQSPDGVPRYWVTLKSIAHTDQGGSSASLSSKSMPVFLDTGATLTLLPPDVTKAMATALNSTEMDLNGFYIVDCGLTKTNGTVDFAFDGMTIRVPYREMLREIKTQPPLCYLGVMQSNTFSLLGDTFLRSAYVVFDLSANMTYMAQYNNCGSSPKSINASSDLKSLSGTCSGGQKTVQGLDSTPETEKTGGKKDSAAASIRGGSVWLGAAAGTVAFAFAYGVLL